jgi:hypothetical protein
MKFDRLWALGFDEMKIWRDSGCGIAEMCWLRWPFFFSSGVEFSAFATGAAGLRGRGIDGQMRGKQKIYIN